MKLIVQIPAYNEEKSISQVIKSIPRKIQGISKVEVLVADDGSTDDTLSEAKKAGADHTIRNTRNSGLAFTFQEAMDTALELGADIIVNTDADNQYNQSEIIKLIKPILNGQADIVSGNRQVESLDHMIPAKKYGNIFGSKVVKFCAGYDIIDASSGFRAYSREAALRLFVTSKHTYTHETLIQSGHMNLRVIEVPVEFKKREGHSKLISSVANHIKKSSSTIIRSTLLYNALKVFSYLGIFLVLFGIIPIIRWFYLTYLFPDGGAHIQSMIVGSILIMSGGFSILLGLLTDMIAINRRYLEELLYWQRKAAIKK